MRDCCTNHQAKHVTEAATRRHEEESRLDLGEATFLNSHLSKVDETVFDGHGLFVPGRTAEELDLLGYPMKGTSGFIEKLPEVLGDVRVQVDHLFSHRATPDLMTLQHIELFCRQTLEQSSEDTVGLSEADLQKMRDILIPSSDSAKTSVEDSPLYLLLHGEPVDFDALASALWSAVYAQALYNVNATIVVPGSNLSSLERLSKRLHGINLVNLLSDVGFHIVSTAELQRSWQGNERVVMVDSHEQHDNRLLRQTRGLPIAGAIDAHTSQASASPNVFTSSQVRATASLIYSLLSADLQNRGRCIAEVVNSSQGTVAAALSTLGLYTDCAMDNGPQSTAQKGDLVVLGALLNVSLRDHAEIIGAFCQSQKMREEAIARAVEESSLYRALVTFDGKGFFVINPKSLLIRLGDDLLGPIAERLRTLYPHLSEVWVLAQHSDSEGKAVWRLAARAETEVAGVDKRIKEILGAQNAGGYRTAGAGTVLPELFSPTERVELQAVPRTLVDELQRRCLVA